MSKNYEIKCKNCKYNTGVKIQGQGYYWAQCSLLDEAKKIIAEKFDILPFCVDYIPFKNSKKYDPYEIDKNTTCMFFEINEKSVEFNKKISSTNKIILKEPETCLQESVIPEPDIMKG